MGDKKEKDIAASPESVPIHLIAFVNCDDSDQYLHLCSPFGYLYCCINLKSLG